MLRALCSLSLQGQLNPDFSAPHINLHSGWGLSTAFVHAFNGHLAYIIGENTIPFSLLYSLFGLIGSCYLARSILLIFSDMRLSYTGVILIFFLPGVLVFTSLLGKDAIIFMCTNVCLYVVIKDNRVFWDYSIFLLLFFIALLIRPYFIAIALIYLCFYTLSTTIGLRTKILMMVLISLIFICTKKILLANYGISSKWSLDSLASIASVNQINMSSGTSLSVLHRTTLGYLTNLPYMIFGNLFLPLFSSNGISLILASMENLFALALLINYLIKRLFYRKMDFNGIINKRAVCIILSYAISGILVLASNNSNLGYAIRVKYLYILPLYAYLSQALLQRSIKIRHGLRTSSATL